MIGTLGYVVLMHHRSPVAWLGHKSKWIRLRLVQEALCWNRSFPSLYPPVMWAQLFGLAKFTPVQGLKRVVNNSELLMQVGARERELRYYGGLFLGARIIFRMWLYPAAYVDVEASVAASRQESLAIEAGYQDRDQ